MCVSVCIVVDLCSDWSFFFLPLSFFEHLSRGNVELRATENEGGLEHKTPVLRMGCTDGRARHMRDTGSERTRQNNAEKVMGLLVLQCFKCSEEKKSLLLFLFLLLYVLPFLLFISLFFFQFARDLCSRKHFCISVLLVLAIAQVCLYVCVCFCFCFGFFFLFERLSRTLVLHELV